LIVALGQGSFSRAEVEHNPDPGFKFLDPERFGYIIVRACFKSPDFIVRDIAGADHYYFGGVPERVIFNGPADFKAAQAGHFSIQQQQIVGTSFEFPHGSAAVFRRKKVDRLFFQSNLDDIYNVTPVIYD
jgi:hypothetical protein